MPLLYEDYASKVEPRSRLEQKLDKMNRGTDKHLTKIAGELTDVNQLTAELGLKSQVLRDLEQQYKEAQRQRLDVGSLGAAFYSRSCS